MLSSASNPSMSNRARPIAMRMLTTPVLLAMLLSVVGPLIIQDSAGLLLSNLAHWTSGPPHAVSTRELGISCFSFVLITCLVLQRDTVSPPLICVLLNNLLVQYSIWASLEIDALESYLPLAATLLTLMAMLFVRVARSARGRLADIACWAFALACYSECFAINSHFTKVKHLVTQPSVGMGYYTIILLLWWAPMGILLFSKYRHLRRSSIGLLA